MIVKHFLLVVIFIQAPGFTVSSFEQRYQPVASKVHSPLLKRQNTPTPQPQPQPAAADKNQVRPDPFNQEVVGANLSLFVTQLKGKLDAITDFGSDVSEIRDQIAGALRIIPQANGLRKTLFATIPTVKEELNLANRLAGQASNRLLNSLREIQKNPADANVIKKHYKDILESFKILARGVDDVTTAAIPRIAVEKKDCGTGEQGGVNTRRFSLLN